MIELATVVSELRVELERAIVSARGQDLRFELGPIELEVAVAVERSATAGGKVRFWVVGLGGEQKENSTGTQRIKLLLTPQVGDGRQSVFVNGEAGPGEE